MPMYIPGQENSFFEQVISVFEDKHHGRHARIVQEGLGIEENGPSWPGADKVYARLYKLLKEMGSAGWKAEVARARKARRKPNPNNAVSDDMRDIIDALKKGDEETLKGYMHKFSAYRE